MRSKSEISSLTLYTQSNISSTIATYSKATIALAESSPRQISRGDSLDL